MAKKGYQRRFVDRLEDRDPNVMWMEVGGGYVERREGHYAAVGDRITVLRGPDILLHTHIIRLGQKVHRGRIVAATTPSWSALREAVLDDPSLIRYFPRFHRKFEEFVAGGYRESHWRDVVLSPASRDGGFDVAAWKRGRQILDEAKAYKPSLLVGHQVVRAAVGLLIEHADIDQVRVTTTSWFAPQLPPSLTAQIPERLVLRDRQQLLRWLASIGFRTDLRR